ncbi:MAG: V-type ATP synthase subunit F [Phycisphaerales bacterium]
MQGKVAIFGSADFVMSFSALGVDCFAVNDNAEEIKTKAEKLIAEKYSLIVVAENVAPAANAVFEQFTSKAVPCVVVVPFTTESKGFAAEGLSKLLKLATGINILKNIG